MSKLEGNERWKSKMLLTEHQEQYENRGRKETKGRATPEELTLIRDCILLPHLLTMIQKGLDELNRSKITLHQMAGRFMLLVMDRISAELYRVKRELKRRSIKVLSEETRDDIVYNRYVCRGYEEKFGMTREIMRSEIRMRLSRTYWEIIHPASDREKEREAGGSSEGESLD
ncbi:hypothetical protein ACF3MZ_12070 [Paenibacillaceae bacterium WGS1546]|uniref:hypothetical protein n=1 Tax=Cohnella sp. WGS1546 TaxID=3366810 RepID=UPI00372CE93E